MGWLIRKIMRSAPPFYYYDGFSAEETKYILDAISKPQIYETALSEYKAAHDERFLSELKASDGFPPIQLILITHDSKIEVKEICEFGGASEKEAQKIEDIWQGIMREYLLYSPNSKHIKAVHSSHYIHLSDAQLVCDVLASSEI